MTMDQMVEALKSQLKPEPPSDTAIAQALENTFGDMMSRADFWFMRSPSPTTTQTFTADDDEYDVVIDGCEKIVSIETRASSIEDWAEIDYAVPAVFNRIRGGLVSPGGTWWTVAGIVQPFKFRIQFTPAPATSSAQWRAFYMLVPDTNNISNLPNRWIRCLFAGALAELKGDSNQEARYERLAQRMAVKEQIVTHTQGIYETNAYDADLMIENADLQ